MKKSKFSETQIVAILKPGDDAIVAKNPRLLRGGGRLPPGREGNQNL